MGAVNWKTRRIRNSEKVHILVKEKEEANKMAKVFRQQALFPVISSRKFVQLALTIAVITCLVSSIDGLKGIIHKSVEFPGSKKSSSIDI